MNRDQKKKSVKSWRSLDLHYRLLIKQVHTVCFAVCVCECVRARLQDGRELGWVCDRAFQITVTSFQQGPHIRNKSW